MKKRIISFILAAIMMLGIFAFVSCNNAQDDEHDHSHPNPLDSNDSESGSNVDPSEKFDYYDIAKEIIYAHDLSVMPLVMVEYGELLPDTDYPKVISKDGSNIIYSYRLLSQTCRDMLNGANADIPAYAWLMIDVENDLLNGYFYNPLTEANDSAYNYFSEEVPTNGSSAREIIFYRVPKN